MPREEKSITFKKLADYFLDYSRLNKKSYKKDEYRVKVLISYFKPNTKINTIKPADIEKFKNFILTDNRGKTTVNRYLENLSKMFNLAIDNDWQTKNPIKKDTKFQNKNYTVRYLTKEEEMRLYQHLPIQLKPIVSVALNTGLRKENILNLKWENLDFNFRFIEVLENKSNKHIKLYMNDILYDLFQSIERESEYIFINPKTKLPYTNIRKSWDKAKKEAGIENFRFHDLRHTVGTRLAKANVPINVIKQILAHSDISTTMRYIHAASSDMQNAMSVLNSYN